MEFRDLSAWRVHISKVAPHSDVIGGKKSFVFVIEVQRIDITSTKENAEDLQWTVMRKYSEFYTLETRLTEFHGEFEDLHLPPKASLFTGTVFKGFFNQGYIRGKSLLESWVTTFLLD